ncbi:MAG: O-antigen ligase family protein, partial [Candidatus Omnitrophica bacterium]|nr:O-antigen ligase family protein [Candidatus Omnitrophota bacterium]
LIKCTFSYGSTYFESFIIPLKRWLTPIFLYFIALNVIRDKATLKKVVIVMMIVTLIVATMASLDYLLEKQYAANLDKSRVGGVFEQPNTLGGFFVYAMFLFLGFFFTYFPNYRSLFMLIPFLVCFRGIMVTFSRGAYLGCGFGAIATTFFKSKILFAAGILLIIFALLNPVLLPAGLRYRMSSTYGDQDKIISFDVEDIADKSATRRILIWRGAIDMIKEYPIFGVGYGLFPHMISSYAAVNESDAHNTYLILAAEMGAPALVIFLLILLMLIKNSWWLYIKTQDRFVRATALGILGGLFGLLMVNMFGSRLNSEEVSAYFWIFAGLIMAAVRMKQKGQIT